MAKFVQVRGLDRVIKNLNNFSERLKGPLGETIKSEGEHIMTDSKQTYVPVKTGVLRSSGVVGNPSISGSEISIKLSYGGAAAPYALRIHEAPVDWNWSVSGTGPKYLEIPVRKGMPNFIKAIKSTVKKSLGDNFK